MERGVGVQASVGPGEAALFKKGSEAGAVREGGGGGHNDGGLAQLPAAVRVALVRPVLQHRTRREGGSRCRGRRHTRSVSQMSQCVSTQQLQVFCNDDGLQSKLFKGGRKDFCIHPITEQNRQEDSKVKLIDSAAGGELPAGDGGPTENGDDGGEQLEEAVAGADELLGVPVILLGAAAPPAAALPVSANVRWDHRWR